MSRAESIQITDVVGLFRQIDQNYHQPSSVLLTAENATMSKPIAIILAAGQGTRMKSDLPKVLCPILERPMIMGELNNTAGAILANFGSADDAVIDVLTGKVSPTGTLPLELPSSDEAVEAQKPGYADDSENPLYKRREGLTF